MFGNTNYAVAGPGQPPPRDLSLLISIHDKRLMLKSPTFRDFVYYYFFAAQSDY